MVKKSEGIRSESYSIAVALEVAKTRTFASALQWPGWTRSGRDEAAALAALLAHGPRYERAISAAQLGFRVPGNLAQFNVTERVTGNATTDFGTPHVLASVDAQPVNGEELIGAVAILTACWDHFELVVRAAEGKPLRKGPRGGGRTVQRIVDHVLEGHNNHLRNIYWRERQSKEEDVGAAVKLAKEADARALAFAASDEMPERGPRGGRLWTPRYFVRGTAWHILDHAWEIEDRVDGEGAIGGAPDR